jgi:hypothetical protein
MKKAFSMLSFALVLFIGAFAVSAEDSVFITLKKPDNLNTNSMTRRQVRTLNLYLNVALTEAQAQFGNNTGTRQLRGGRNDVARGLHAGHFHPVPTTCAKCINYGHRKIECQIYYILCYRRRERFLIETLIHTNETKLDFTATDPMTGYSCTPAPQNETITGVETIATQENVTFANNLDAKTANATMFIC